MAVTGPDRRAQAHSVAAGNPPRRIAEAGGLPDWHERSGWVFITRPPQGYASLSRIVAFSVQIFNMRFWPPSEMPAIACFVDSFPSEYE